MEYIKSRIKSLKKTKQKWIAERAEFMRFYDSPSGHGDTSWYDKKILEANSRISELVRLLNSGHV